MSGVHNHSHQGKNATRNIAFAFLLNLIFATIELVGGLLTGSVAILADAVHDFGDTLTLGLSFILERLSLRKRTTDYTYGFRRLSLLSSLISGIILSTGSGIILYEAIPQFWTRESIPNGPWMMALAALGVAINGIAALRLRGGNSRNEGMLSWHLIEDVLGWVAVFFGAIVITLTSWTWVDPLLACGVACFVLYNVTRTLWGTIQIFLQRKPEDFNQPAFIEKIKDIEGVVDLHDIHAWSLDGESNILSLHVVVHPTFQLGTELENLKLKIRAAASAMGKFHTTVEIEMITEKTQGPCNL